MRSRWDHRLPADSGSENRRRTTEERTRTRTLTTVGGVVPSLDAVCF